MTKLLRVGVLTPITRLNPTAPEHETALVLKQVLETPYLALPGKAELEPVLFSGPLERVGAAIGTGPFAFAPASRPERVNLARNPHAHRRPALDEIVFEVHASARAGLRPSAVSLLDLAAVDLLGQG